jgi:hypothetical protein
VFGIHPYDCPLAPNAVGEWNQWETLGETYQIMMANGDGAEKRRGTEHGAPINSPRGSQSVAEAVQAAATFVTAAWEATLPFLETMFWSTAQDGPNLANNTQRHVAGGRSCLWPHPFAS